MSDARLYAETGRCVGYPKVKVTSPSKLEILFSKAISSVIYNGSWQPTTYS